MPTSSSGPTSIDRTSTGPTSTEPPSSGPTSIEPMASGPTAHPRRRVLALAASGAVGLALPAQAAQGAQLARAPQARLHTPGVTAQPAAAVPPVPPPPRLSPRFAAAPAPSRAGGDPYSSGRLGPWRSMSRSASTAAASAQVAAHPRGVRLIGDSISMVVLRPLFDQLRALGRPLSWDGWSGRPTAPCVASALADADAGLLPATLVVVSGANDIFDTAAFQPAVQRLLTGLPSGTQVLWATPYAGRRTSPIADTRSSALLSLQLEQAAAAHSNVHLVRWFEFLAKKPSRLPAYVPDGVHPKSATGSAAFVSLLTASLRRLD